MAQHGHRMTQNDPKWPKNDPTWPKITPKSPKMTPGFTHFFRKFFFTKKSGSANFFAFRMYACASHPLPPPHEEGAPLEPAPNLRDCLARGNPCWNPLGPGPGIRMGPVGTLGPDSRFPPSSRAALPLSLALSLPLSLSDQHAIVSQGAQKC